MLLSITLLVLVMVTIIPSTTSTTAMPSESPTAVPTTMPSESPTAVPTTMPSESPTTAIPTTAMPSATPTTAIPTTAMPSAIPTAIPTTALPTSMPSSQPSQYEWAYQTIWDKNRWKKNGLCENSCSGHGTCSLNQNCFCYTDMDGEPSWTGPDCSQRTCPIDNAWVAESAVGANDMHPRAECSNKGNCDRKTGLCECYEGYDGNACQRTVCPDDCNDRGICWPITHVAGKWGRSYSTPWDSMKENSCLCDFGFRGPSCALQECPTGPDPLGGLGNEAGRDCSGRGLCDYETGICQCFSGFKGNKCQTQTMLY